MPEKWGFSSCCPTTQGSLGHGGRAEVLGAAGCCGAAPCHPPASTKRLPCSVRTTGPQAALPACPPGMLSPCGAQVPAGPGQRRGLLLSPAEHPGQCQHCYRAVPLQTPLISIPATCSKPEPLHGLHNTTFFTFFSPRPRTSS